MYIETSIHLSPAQIKKLIAGHAVRLKHADLTGPIVVCLTKVQANRMAKAQQAGKGMQLKLSEAQLQACASKSGEGIWEDVKHIGAMVGHSASAVAKATAKAVGASGPLAKNLVGQLVKQHGGKALDLLAGKAGEMLSDMVPEALQQFVSIGIDMGRRHSKEQLDALIEGMKKGSGLAVAPRKVGRGFFGSALSTLGLGLYAPTGR